MRKLPDFDLPTADGGRLTPASLEGRPTYLYLARHPGCFVCQTKLEEALEHRAALQQVGGDLVLVFQTGEEYGGKWAQHARSEGIVPADLQVAMDPDGSLYERLGTVRGKVFAEVAHTLGQLWRARRNIRRWRLTRNDMLRMGADVGVAADGTVVHHHICQDPEDRADPGQVVAALAR